jgi:hypothetical protein
MFRELVQIRTLAEKKEDENFDSALSNQQSAFGQS